MHTDPEGHSAVEPQTWTPGDGQPGAHATAGDAQQT
jgi:hypothetical protein